MSPRLICYGDLCIDIFARVDTFPQPGQDAVVRQVAFLPAGSALNCAVAAARLGITVEFVGVTGRDMMGDLLVDDLRKNGIGSQHVRRADEPTAVTIAVLDVNGERTFLSYRGANAMPYGAVPADLIRAGDTLHLSGYSFQNDHSRQTALALIEQAKARGAGVSLDPSFQFASARPSLADLDLIFPNLDEAQLLSGMDDPARAAALIRESGPKTVIVTLGAQGCYIHSDQIPGFVPSYPAQVVDTTGAGDAFCGGFLAGLFWSLDTLNAAKIGHMAACHVIGQIGGHAGAPSLDDLMRFAGQHDAALARMLRQLRPATR